MWIDNNLLFFETEVNSRYRYIILPLLTNIENNNYYYTQELISTFAVENLSKSI